MSVELTDILVTVVIALVSWNLKETYGLNARAAHNESQLEDHERRLSRLETGIVQR